MPKFSVLIANYNNTHLIQQALDSGIKGQIISDFEAIVVDDGSTDNSRSTIGTAAASSEGKPLCASIEQGRGELGMPQ